MPSYYITLHRMRGALLLFALLAVALVLVQAAAAKPTLAQKAAHQANQERKFKLALEAAVPTPRCAAPVVADSVKLDKSLKSYKVGGSVVASCKKGFGLVKQGREGVVPVDGNTETLICQGTSAQPDWSIIPSVLDCQPIACKPMKLLDENLRVDNATGVHGDVRRFSCAAPYTMDGNADVRCNAGRWRPNSQPTCFINECDAFPAPLNGTARITSNSTSTVRTLKYSCDIGFKLFGEAESYCLPTKKWSNDAPECKPFGVTPYVNRAYSFSSGSLSIDNKFVLDGLLATARKTPNCIGFTISKAGAVRAVLLHSDESFLVRAKGFDTYLFTKNEPTPYRKHSGFKAVKQALLGHINFAREALVVNGIRKAVNALQATQPDLIGFSVAKGRGFKVRLASWEALPLRQSKKFHSFTLSSIESGISEIGCFASSKYLESPLATQHTLPNQSRRSRASRLSCAAAARRAGHAHFALSDGKCFSGAENPAKYGGAADGSCGGRFAPLFTSRKPGAKHGAFHTFRLTPSVRRAEAVGASRCTRQPGVQLSVYGPKVSGSPVKDVRSEERCQYLCSATLQCGSAVYDKKKLECTLYQSRTPDASTPSRFFTSFVCTRPALVNGGFEFSGTDGAPSDEIGDSIDGEFGEPWNFEGMDLALKVKGGVRGWTLSGPVGVAIAGSSYADSSARIPEGNAILYLEAGGEIHQLVQGLTIGQTYELSFDETFRTSTDYVSGASLIVSVGDRVVYSNVDVRVPLWQTRTVSFEATATQATIKFAVTTRALRERMVRAGDVPPTTISTAVLLDSVTLAPFHLAQVRPGKKSETGSGVLYRIRARNPAVIAAVREDIKNLPNTVGFVLRKGEAFLISKRHARQTVDQAGSTIYYSNGTEVKGASTQHHAGRFHFSSSPAVRRALVGLAAIRSNSIGYAVGTGTKFSAQVVSGRALPLIADAGSDVHLFNDAPKELGCWNERPGATPGLFDEVHQVTGAMSKRACAAAAAHAGHRLFAIQNRQCLSGDNKRFRVLGGPSSACTLRCRNGKDVCGGEHAAMVYRLPAHTRVSHGGLAQARPAVGDSDLARAQFIFSQPGKVDYSTVGRIDPVAAAKIAAAAGNRTKRTKSGGFKHSLVYHFPGLQAHAVSMYTVSAGSTDDLVTQAPRRWTLFGSVNGRNWTVIDRVSNATFSRPGQSRSFQIRNIGKYHLVKLTVYRAQKEDTNGFAVSGITYSVPSSSLVSLSALYRFEEPTVPGLDSSARFNDLEVYGLGASVAQADENDQPDAAIGRGYLELNDPRRETFLAVDLGFSAPTGLPAEQDSFTIAFHFQFNTTAFPSAMGVLGWGDATKRSKANSVQFLSDLDGLTSSFGKVGAGLVARNAALTDGKWHHYAVTFDFDSGRHAIYLDGEEIGSRLYEPTYLDVAAAGFRIGSTTAVGDQFRGRLDDIAIFRGAMTKAQINRIRVGDLKQYLPLSCQQLSDRFSIAAGESWGTATDRQKKEFLRARCNTKPSNCQTLSDVYQISPQSFGSSDRYVQDAYKSMTCDTWPSFALKANTTGQCFGRQSIRLNVLDIEEARLTCLRQVWPPCKTYVWSAQARTHTLADGSETTVPANTIAMCDDRLQNIQSLDGAESGRKLRNYWILPDTSNRCDEATGKIVAGVMSNVEARILCDKQRKPACLGYIWSGPIGIGRNASATPTPNTIMMCSSYRDHHATDVPGSKYETAAVVGDYMVEPKRAGKCSAAAQIAIKYDVMSSLEARLHCDSYDGKTGPRCLSYTWAMSLGEARLCSGVPQGELEVQTDAEVGWITPTGCQEFSNRWSVAYNSSWGYAPQTIRKRYMDMRCTTSPTPCQALSDYYGLSATEALDPKLAAEIPGSIRDLWINQGCTTSPQGVGMDRQKPRYQRIAKTIRAVEERVEEVDDILTRAARTKSEQKSNDLLEEAVAARHQLDEVVRRINV